MTSYALDLYRQMFLSIKRGSHNGCKSIAKPIFLISLIDTLPFMQKNLFEVNNPKLIEVYKVDMMQYGQNIKTPMSLPYFHLHSEPFYNILWKDPERTIKLAHSPSSKVLSEYTSGATLDKELWELLQDEGNRNYLRKCIIENFLNKE